MVRRRHLLFGLLLCLSLMASAEEVLRQKIFDDNFKTLQVYPRNDRMGLPVMALDGSGGGIVVAFDEIADDRSWLRYELIHCDADWRKSRLVDSEFLDGFNMGYVEDYQFSRATLEHYVHYRIFIPDGAMRPLVSGNYIVRVYREDDPDETVLQARFMVTENSMSIDGSVSPSTDIGFNDRWQQLDLSVDTKKVDVGNLNSDLIVVVEQNGRSDNAVTLTAPSSVFGNKVRYAHNRALIFPAGNEYRRFEIVNTGYPTMGVADIDYADPLYVFTLNLDAPRADDRYRFDRTQQGRYFIREYNSSENDIEADYAMVLFTLESDPLDDFDIFIEGDLTGRTFDPASIMDYNPVTRRYEKVLMLKQGAYNYQYLALPRNGDNRISPTSTIEGDFYETQNEYTVKVYHRQPMGRYDRLVAVATFMFK